VRTYSPARTIGGGVVLDAGPAKRKGGGRSDLEFLHAAEAGERKEMIRSLLASSRKGIVPIAEIAQRLQISDAEVRGELQALEANGEARIIATGALLEATVSRLKEEIEAHAGGASAKDAFRAGVAREEIRRGLHREVDLSLFQTLLGELTRDGKVTVRGEMVLPAEGALSEKLTRAAEKVEEVLARHRLAPPLPAQLAEEAGIETRELLSVIDFLARLGRVVKVAPTLVYRSAEVDEVRSLLRKALAENKGFTVADFKERTGVSRKYAVPLLEYFDRERLTRREGDLRVPGPAYSEEKRA
jgi:selenocysteine-specific elongation factor